MKQGQEKNKSDLKQTPNKPNPGTIKFQILMEMVVLLTKGLTKVRLIVYFTGECGQPEGICEGS